jgi:twitching motility protein PilT
VHLKVGQPGARVRGDLVYFRLDPVRPENTEAVAHHVIGNREVLRMLNDLREYDTSYEAEGVGRFRVNVYRQRGSLAVVMRFIPLEVPTLEQLGAPRPCVDLAMKDRGLVLCVGAAGNGKSSTLAAMIGHMNHNLSRHIVTIEDPIEFLHVDDRSSISQREIGPTPRVSRAHSVRPCARSRRDPVGEIRDGETWTSR